MPKYAESATHAVARDRATVAYWFVFFALAGPLFRDVNAALGIDIKQFFTVSSLRGLRNASKPEDG